MKKSKLQSMLREKEHMVELYKNFEDKESKYMTFYYMGKVKLLKQLLFEEFR